MKMAKASEQEMEDAIRLAQLTDSVCNVRGFEDAIFPGEKESDEPEYFDMDNANDLREFYDRVSKLSGGLMRVAFGYSVLVDNLCDKSKDILETKPDVMQFDEGDMKLLKEFIAADATFVETSALVEATSPTLDPWTFDAAKKAFDAAFSVRISKALEFALKVSVAVKKNTL